MKPLAEYDLRDAALEADIAAVLEPRLTASADLWYHTFDARRSVRGFPDYVILVGPWLILAELKRIGGRLSTAQAAWLVALPGPYRLSLLVGGHDGADQLVRLVERMKSGAVAPAELGAASSAVQVLGVVSDAARRVLAGASVAVAGSVGPSFAAVGSSSPTRRRRDTRRRPRGS